MPRPAPVGHTFFHEGTGTVWVKLPAGHPMAVARRYGYLHRVVVADRIGRPLLPTEIVRHKNGDKTDNRPGNLQLVIPSDSERFWSRVRRGGPDSCWEWQGYRQWAGYGVIYIYGKLRRAHRVAYESEIGPIPPGMVVMHACDRPACVNPAHLTIGTQAENIADRVAKGRTRNGRSGLRKIDRG